MDGSEESCLAICALSSSQVMLIKALLKGVIISVIGSELTLNCRRFLTVIPAKRPYCVRRQKGHTLKYGTHCSDSVLFLCISYKRILTLLLDQVIALSIYLQGHGNILCFFGQR